MPNALDSLRQTRDKAALEADKLLRIRREQDAISDLRSRLLLQSQTLGAEVLRCYRTGELDHAHLLELCGKLDDWGTQVKQHEARIAEIRAERLPAVTTSTLTGSCPACAKPTPVGAAFCHHCGAALTRSDSMAATCSSCGQPMTEKARYCQTCGAPVTTPVAAASDTLQVAAVPPPLQVSQSESLPSISETPTSLDSHTGGTLLPQVSVVAGNRRGAAVASELVALVDQLVSTSDDAIPDILSALAHQGPDAYYQLSLRLEQLAAEGKDGESDKDSFSRLHQALDVISRAVPTELLLEEVRTWSGWVSPQTELMLHARAEEVTPQIVELMKSPEVKRNCHYLELLGRLGGLVARDTLLLYARLDPKHTARVAAVRAFIGTSDPIAAAGLVKALRNEISSMADKHIDVSMERTSRKIGQLTYYGLSFLSGSGVVSTMIGAALTGIDGGSSDEKREQSYEESAEQFVEVMQAYEAVFTTCTAFPTAELLALATNSHEYVRRAAFGTWIPLMWRRPEPEIRQQALKMAQAGRKDSAKAVRKLAEEAVRTMR